MSTSGADLLAEIRQLRERLLARREELLAELRQLNEFLGEAASSPRRETRGRSPGGAPRDPNSRSGKIRTALGNGPHTFRQLASVVPDWNAGRLSATLSRMVTVGHIRRVDRGVYALAEPPREAAE